MAERFRERLPSKLPKFAARTLQTGVAASVLIAGSAGIYSKAETPKLDDGDVAASRFVMTPPGGQKWPKPNPFLEALNREVQTNLFKMGEKLKIEWYEKDSPIAVVIPKLGIQSLLIPAERIPDPKKPGIETLETPNFGIAVPRVMIKNGRNANVFIFGHRQWGGVEQPFGDIAILTFGDTATIVSPGGELSDFEVDEFKLVDYADPEAVISASAEKSVVTFQTTAMEKGTWLIDESQLEGKVELPTETSGHLALQVVLQEVD